MPARLIVVAHNIRSLANVGALFRTCDAAGVSELVLSGITGAPPDRRIDKVALGATEMISWRVTREPHELAAVLEGRFVVVLEQHDDSVTSADLALPPERDVVLVACEELFGADDEVLRHADAILELPMRGGKQSLNVAVAAGIAVYDLADRMWGTSYADLASRQDRPPVREGVLTRGVTTGEIPSR